MKPEYAVVEYRQAVRVLAPNQHGELGLDDHVVLERNINDGLTSTIIASRLDYPAVVVKSGLVL